ncbi:MAG: GGDEF domain-containing protein [Firmicutes bacterium]|nr:GGDEF domain-containing protein [Bacillota bacterium]MCL5039671.1 GGDEF domain-containing protein [Bacillota bacterium]
MNVKRPVWDVRGVYVAMGGGFLILAILIIAIVLFPMNNALERELRTEISLYLRYQSERIIEILENDLEVAEQIASLESVKEILRAGHPAGKPLTISKQSAEKNGLSPQDQVKAALAAHKSVLGVTLADAHGQKVLQEGLPVQILSLETVKELGVLKDLADLGGGKKGLIVLSPVRLDELEILGYLLAVFDFEEVASLLRLPFDGHGNLFLTRGQDVLFQPEKLVDPKFPAVLRGGWQEQPAGSFTRAWFEPASYSLHTQFLLPTAWTLTLVVNNDLFFAEMRQDLSRFIIVLLVVAEFVFMLTSFSVRPIIQTLSEEKRFFQMAVTDKLTGLSNRHLLQEVLHRELIRFQRHKKPLASLFADIDYFKDINDRYGHLVGDQVLQETAKILQGHVRRSDLVARFGGEEFVVLLPETTLAQAVKVAEKLRLAVKEHRFSTEKGGLQITISLGVTEAKAGDDTTTILERADKALYQAKTGGRDQVAVLNPDGV